MQDTKLCSSLPILLFWTTIPSCINRTCNLIKSNTKLPQMHQKKKKKKEALTAMGQLNIGKPSAYELLEIYQTYQPNIIGPISILLVLVGMDLGLLHWANMSNICLRCHAFSENFHKHSCFEKQSIKTSICEKHFNALNLREECALQVVKHSC